MKKLSSIFYLSSYISFLLININLAQTMGSMETLSIPDGISSPNVRSIYQDRFGYIWMLTEDGLNRYDGNKIKVYRNDPDDPYSLFGNSTYSAAEDKDGYLWIGGIGLVNRFDYATESFEQFNLTSEATGDQGSWVTKLYTDAQGRVWAGTLGGTIHILNRESATFDVLYHSNNIEANYSGEIWDICQLKNGKILFANKQRGIFQYDESTGKLTDFFLDNAYSPKYIFRIQEDDDGTIWFSGEDIIVRYNPNFYSYKSLDGFQVLSKMYHLGYHKISDTDYVFISEPYGLIRYNPKTSEVTEKITTPMAPYWFISDKFGIVWIAAHGGVVKYDPNREPIGRVELASKTSQDERGNLLNAISLDSSNPDFVWLLSSDNTLIKYNLTEGNQESQKLSLPEPFQNYNADFFIRDKNGNFYFNIRNSQGILKYSPANRHISKLEHIKTAFYNGFRAADLAFDQSNNLFIAGQQGVVYSNLILENENVIPSYTIRQYSSKFNNQIQQTLKKAKDIALITKADESLDYHMDFALDNESCILIHSMGEGIIDRSPPLFDYGTLSNSAGTTIYSMTDFSKTFHAGGGIKNRREYTVLKLPAGAYTLKYTMDAGHSYNQFNAKMPADSSLYGIQLYQISENAYNTIKNQLSAELSDSLVLPVGGVEDIEISRKFANSVYLSSTTQGLFRYNSQNHSYIHYTFGTIENNNLKNALLHCYEDIAGNVWVSTRQGLILLNPDNGKWRVFTEKDGLPSNNILRTVEDTNGNLWIISLGGLSKFNKDEPAENWNFVNYDTRDGLAGYSFRGDPLKTPDGEIIFIVGNALQRFTPGRSNYTSPDIIINDLKISDISVFNPGSPVKLDKSLMEIGHITLPFDLNDLSFNFNVIHYSRPYKNRVFYKLEGFNKDWIEPELHSATFTNLEPGDYEFKVKGTSADGIASHKEASIKIEITPPWWRTTFAYISYFIILAALIFATDRIQRHRVLIKERAATAIKEAELRAQLAEAENERKSKELEEARALQLSMLPKKLPQLPHLDIAVYMQTATEVGGDYYDFHVSMDGNLTVVIGDATGHGMQAGTMVTTAKSLFNSYAPNPDILFSFQEITRCIKQMNFGKLSMCMTMLKIKGNKLQMSTAGMPPAFIFRRETRVTEEHLFKAMPLGTMDNFPYEIMDTTLKVGDTILLISDGLPELKNKQEQLYGYQKVRNVFEDVAEKSPEDIVSHLKNEGASWVNNEDPDDDVTFVVIKVK